MYIKKLKVRPRKTVNANVCAPHLAAMLACWAATSDLNSTSACRDSATALYDCMRTAPMRKKMARPTINYHLSRLGKIIQ